MASSQIGINVSMSGRIRPFYVEVPQSDLDDLQRRLALTRWPIPVTGRRTCKQGVSLQRARELVEYWENGYSWRRCEEFLNQFNHYLFSADDVDIHFLYARSRHRSAMPLLLTHGWPGSILEFTNIIDRLTDPEFFGGKAVNAFHVVVPSLPGFGFSGKPRTGGWNIEKIARTWGELMAELGYQEYVAQGGDLGGLVTQSMAQQKAAGLKGIHLNLVFAGPGQVDEVDPGTQFGLMNPMKIRDEDMGCAMNQPTRSQILGYGLSDSPAGLATWIYEKFHSWSDGRSDAQSVFSKDQLLDNISLYWLTKSSHSSVRIFWEIPQTFGVQWDIKLPVGISMYRSKRLTACRKWAECIYPNLTYWNNPPGGGHFASLENPEGFVQELRSCFANI